LYAENDTPEEQWEEEVDVQRMVYRAMKKRERLANVYNQQQQPTGQGSVLAANKYTQNEVNAQPVAQAKNTLLDPFSGLSDGSSESSFETKWTGNPSTTPPGQETRDWSDTQSADAHAARLHPTIGSPSVVRLGDPVSLTRPTVDPPVCNEFTRDFVERFPPYLPDPLLVGATFLLFFF
jgi:hypothetical protein